MYCSNCGNELINNIGNCQNCGKSIGGNEKTKLSKSTKTLVTLVTILLIISAIFLPFHYVIGYGELIIFSKEKLSLNYTFITRNTVDKLIFRYNRASFIEQISLRREYIFIKLIEEGIIGHVDD